jgi:hypothetical protein
LPASLPLSLSKDQSSTPPLTPLSLLVIAKAREGVIAIAAVIAVVIVKPDARRSVKVNLANLFCLALALAFFHPFLRFIDVLIFKDLCNPNR